MKQRILSLVVMVAMMAASVSVTSCSKDDDDVIPSVYAGTWTCDEFYFTDNRYAGYSIATMTVTLNPDGTWTWSNSKIFDGSGTCSIKTGNVWEDGYCAIITFYQDGKVMTTATVRSYKNDHLTGYVQLQGYDDVMFIFKKQKQKK